MQDSDEKEEKQMDFKIEDCLEYLKSGMEAIIEDSVTSRFEAEELKNWNLLTRTNRRYEFISWKLTVIWVVGFLLRYIVLMPLRVIICFIGVSQEFELELCEDFINFLQGLLVCRCIHFGRTHSKWEIAKEAERDRLIDWLSYNYKIIIRRHKYTQRAIQAEKLRFLCCQSHFADWCYNFIDQLHFFTGENSNNKSNVQNISLLLVDN